MLGTQINSPHRNVTMDNFRVQATRKRRCVLSIDGGGVRGLIPAQVLEHLESSLQAVDGPNARIADYFDTVAGTSTGGIIAAMIAAPDQTGRPLFTAKEISDFYFTNASKIFPSSSIFRKITSLFGPKYSEKSLEQLLEQYIGDLRMKDTLVSLVIPTFDTKLQQPVFFTTSEAKNFESKNAFVRDVVRGTSAAPTYLPPKNFTTTEGTEFNLVDGGLAANNPTLVAIIQAFKDCENEYTNKTPEQRIEKLEDLLVISLGCGNQTVSYTANQMVHWGPLSWVINGAPIVSMLLNGSSDIVDHTTTALFQLGLDHKNFLRIQTSKLEGSTSEVDNSKPENLQTLAKLGKELLDEPVQMINFSTGAFEPLPGNETNGEAIQRIVQSLSESRKAKHVSS